MEAQGNGDRRQKDRKERNLASIMDRVTRDSHHHGSSGVSLVHSSCMCQWWVTPRHLAAQSFIRCLGRIFPRQQRVPHVPPVPCMYFFLSPGSGRSGRELEPRHIFHDSIPVYSSF